MYINVVINWQLSKQSIRWPVSHDHIAGSGVDPSRSSIFLKLSADKLLVFKWSQVQVVFNMCRTIKILISNWPRKLKFSQFLQAEKTCQFMPVAFDFSHQGHALVTLYVQFLCSDWSKFDRWVHAENLCSILKLVYFESWSWQSFVSACDVFNCLFPLDVQKEILLLSRSFKSLLLFTASLFIGVLVEKYVACQSRKSDFGWHRFRVSPCLRLFSLCTLVRFETIIWPSSRFDYKLIEL